MRRRRRMTSKKMGKATLSSEKSKSKTKYDKRKIIVYLSYIG